MYDVVNISRFIQELRKEHNFTQKYVAEKLNVSVQAVSKWETGKSCPDIDLYIPLSELFGITVVELMKGHRINPEELKEETAETLVNVVSKSNKILKYAVITGIVLVALIILGCMVFNVYKINANRLADLISFSYVDDKFKVNDLYLTISNDYKTQEYMGGNLEIVDKTILENLKKIDIKFCYEQDECYTVFNNNVNADENIYSIVYINLKKNSIDVNSEDGLYNFENVLSKINLNILCYYNNGIQKKYNLHLKFRYIFHNHSNMFQI